MCLPNYWSSVDAVKLFRQYTRQACKKKGKLFPKCIHNVRKIISLQYLSFIHVAQDSYSLFGMWNKLEEMNKFLKT